MSNNDYLKEGKLRIAYCRESTKDQAVNGFNLADQEKKIRAYADLYDITDVDYFIEDGYSAKTLNRPKMKELLNLVENNKVEMVIVHNLDRLSRSVKDMAELIALFEEHSVNLISLTESLDTKSAVGRFFVNMIASIAQWEQETISERTNRGLNESFNQGNWARSSVPFGFKKINKKLVIDEDNRKTVEDIFRLIASKEETTNSLFHKLNSDHVGNIKWSQQNLARMIRNPIYIGTVKVGNKEIKDYIESIIDFDVWKNANDAMNDYVRDAKYTYIFGYLLYDAESGNQFYHQATKKKNGYYLYYQTVKNNKMVRINQQAVLDAIGGDLKKILTKQKGEDIKRLNSKIARHQRRIDLIREDYKFGGITAKEMYASIAELEDVITECEEDISILKTKKIDLNQLHDETLKSLFHKHYSKIEIDVNSSKDVVIVKTHKID